MYKTLENSIRMIQKNTIEEELGEASKERMKIKAVAREEDKRDGEVPTRQEEIKKKVVDEAKEKKNDNTKVIIDPELKPVKEAKDEREYGYEGEMASSQLKSIIQNAEAMLGMLQDGTDLPEWVQSKITLAQDYIMSAKDYLSTEMSEDVDNNFALMSRNTTRGKVVKTKSGEYIATNHQGSTKSFKDKAKADEHASGGMKEEIEQVDENFEVTDDHISRVHDAIKNIRKKHGSLAYHKASEIAKEAGKGITPQHVHAAFGKNIKSQTEKGGRMVTNQLKTRSNEPNRYGWKTRDEWLKEEIEQVDEAKSMYTARGYLNNKVKYHIVDRRGKIVSHGHKTYDDAVAYAKKMEHDFIVAKKKLKEEIEQVDEKLKGKQHKLDRNKNGKLDAQDFKLLRKEERFAESNGISDSLLNAVKSIVTKESDIEQVNEKMSEFEKLAARAAWKKNPETKGKPLPKHLQTDYQKNKSIKKEELSQEELSDDELARLEEIARKLD